MLRHAAGTGDMLHDMGTYSWHSIADMALFFSCSVTRKCPLCLAAMLTHMSHMCLTLPHPPHVPRPLLVLCKGKVRLPGLGLGLGFQSGHGDDFLRLHTLFSIVGLANSHIQSLTTIRLGGYSSRSAFPPNPPIRFRHRAWSGCAIGFWLRLKWFSP